MENKSPRRVAISTPAIIMAHEIIFRGRSYKMYIAQISERQEIVLTPFQGETHSTVFINGKIEIFNDDSGRWFYREA